MSTPCASATLALLALVAAASVVSAQSGSVAPFSDDPMQAGVTVPKPEHVVELRKAIDDVRAVARLPAASWTDPALSAGSTSIQAIHIVELRARLDEALIALNYAPGVYTDPILTAGAIPIRAIHVQEIRDRLRQVPPLCGVSLSFQSVAAPPTVSSYDVGVAASDGCTWTASANAGWIALDAASGTGRAMIGFSLAPNPTTAVRIGLISVSGQTLAVSQAAGTSRILVTHPSSPSTYGPGELVSLNASVDPASNTSQVDFYVDGIRLGTSTGPPFSVPWFTGSGGITHTIAAVAVDAIGGPAGSPGVVVSVVNCPAIDPTDNAADDAGLQCRLDRGGTIELHAGSPGYIVNGTPKDGYAHGRGVYITAHDTHLTVAPGDAIARVIAGPDLWADILRTDPALDATGVHDLEIDHVVFDGRVDVLDGNGQPVRARRDQCDERASGNLTLNVHGLRLHDSQSISAMCGSGLQMIGIPNDRATPAFPFVIERSYIGNNGRDYKHLGAGARWADGMTLLWCDRGTIVNNLFFDNTDIDVMIGGSFNCTIAFNTIAHLNKYAFTGLNIGSALGGVRGDHSGSNFTDNRVFTARRDTAAEPQACVPFGTPDPGLVEDQLSIGILVGTHPWDSTIWVTEGGTLARNRSHHNVANFVVDGVCAGAPDAQGDCPLVSPPGLVIDANVSSCPRGTLGKGCTVGGLSYAINPDHSGIPAGWQAGYSYLWYDHNTCSASGPVP